MKTETIAIFPRSPPCVGVGSVLASSCDLLLMTITPPAATVTSHQAMLGGGLCSGPVASVSVIRS